MMMQPHPHPLPLRMRIKARAAPGLDGPTAHSLRRLSERKLHSPRCSLVKAILIQNALPLLNRYDAELLPAYHVVTREAQQEDEEEMEETDDDDDVTMLALDEELNQATPTASTVTAVLPMSPSSSSAASAAEARDGDPASDAPVASSRAPPASGRPRLLSRSRRFQAHARPVDLDHDVDVDLGAGDSSDSDEGDGTVFAAGPTAAPFDEFDDVFDILDPRPLVASNEARSASLPSSPSASACVSMPRLAKRPSSCCSFASSSSMDEEPDDEGGREAKRAKLPLATATAAAAAASAASSCSTDHMTSTRQPLPALACV